MGGVRCGQIAQAQQWDIGTKGRDMTEKKEGGTWLAVSKKGRLGVVLNFAGSQLDPEKMGRGFLVADYLRSPRTGLQHLDSLRKDSQKYNKFHLVTVDFEEDPVLSHYSNGDAADRVTSILDGSFAVGNSPLDKPYEKVRKGRARFEEITERYNDDRCKAQLVDELLSLLKWRDRHVDPAGMEMSHIPKSFREEYSSVFIDMPAAGYGTRTHTVLLVDRYGKADFYEWTLKEPIGETNREWVSCHEEFHVGGNRTLGGRLKKEAAARKLQVAWTKVRGKMQTLGMTGNNCNGYHGKTMAVMGGNGWDVEGVKLEWTLAEKTRRKMDEEREENVETRT